MQKYNVEKIYQQRVDILFLLCIQYTLKNTKIYDLIKIQPALVLVVYYPKQLNNFRQQ
jgi:hypothetical protein